MMKVGEQVGRCRQFCCWVEPHCVPGNYMAQTEEMIDGAVRFNGASQMKSGKQRRQELKIRKQTRQTNLLQAAEARRAADRAAENQAMVEWARSHGGVPVDCTALTRDSDYWHEVDFVKRRYYLDQPFTCAGCNSQEVWTALQQKWWYEVAKGSIYSTAKFCRTCRRQEQARRTEARRIHLEGIAKKHPRDL